VKKTDRNKSNPEHKKVFPEQEKREKKSYASRVIAPSKKRQLFAPSFFSARSFSATPCCEFSSNTKTVQ
jgi:hypothetical protein